MKMGKAHRVPLSTPALAILSRHGAAGETTARLSWSGRKPLSNMSMTMLLRRMKCE